MMKRTIKFFFIFAAIALVTAFVNRCKMITVHQCKKNDICREKIIQYSKKQFGKLHGIPRLAYVGDWGNERAYMALSGPFPYVAPAWNSVVMAPDSNAVKYVEYIGDSCGLTEWISKNQTDRDVSALLVYFPPSYICSHWEKLKLAALKNEDVWNTCILNEHSADIFNYSKKYTGLSAWGKARWEDVIDSYLRLGQNLDAIKYEAKINKYWDGGSGKNNWLRVKLADKDYLCELLMRVQDLPQKKNIPDSAYDILLDIRQTGGLKIAGEASIFLWNKIKNRDSKTRGVFIHSLVFAVGGENERRVFLNKINYSNGYGRYNDLVPGYIKRSTGVDAFHSGTLVLSNACAKK